jgi:hypothetical protein
MSEPNAIASAVAQLIPFPASTLCTRCLTCLCNLECISYPTSAPPKILTNQATHKAFRERHARQRHLPQHLPTHTRIRRKLRLAAARPHHARPRALQRRGWRVLVDLREVRLEVRFVRRAEGRGRGLVEDAFVLGGFSGERKRGGGRTMSLAS